MMEIYIKSSNAAKDYFYQGEHFLEAAWRCFGQKNDTGFAIVKEDKFQQLSVPCVVNAAFSCEMFFKSLLHQMKIQYGRKNGHNLHSLYKLLPSKVQNIIAKFCGNQKDNAVFENWIENHAEDFVDIRYLIERDGWTAISPMSMLTIAENLSTITAYLLDNENLEEML